MISLDISTHTVTIVKLNSGVMMSGSLFLSGKRKMMTFRRDLGESGSVT